jgi:hypothetical protein
MTIKPKWVTGEWSEEDSLALLEELEEAQLTRSLTNEEQAWYNAQGKMI